MRGATTARQYVSSFLQLQFPPLLVKARQDWSLPEYRLPTPVRYDAYDPLTMSAYPMIGSLVRRTSRWTRNDLTAQGEPVYSARYSMQVFLWVSTPVDQNGVYSTDPYIETLRLRDDEMGLLRSCLLTTPSLNSNGKLDIDESTLTEDYLDAIKLSKESNTWIAGGTLSFEMRVSETAYVPQIGTVETTHVETSVFPHQL